MGRPALAPLLVALLLIALAACGEREAPDGGPVAPAPTRARVEAPVSATPVRVGDAGPAFRACQSAGTPRGDAPLSVRAGPFDAASVAGAVAPGGRFFVCARSIDQSWLGVVYDPAGALSPGCGVSAPLPEGRDYAGPCRSGWVASAAVRTVAA